jgi:hypothetical protein
MSKPSDATNYIYRHGTAPNTRAAVSQKNKVYGYMVNSTQPGFQQIGVVSEFGHDESRTIEPIRGVGFGDQVAELVPGVTEPMTLTLNKTLLYAVNLFQAVGYKGGVEGLVRSLKHHRWPFDIKQELVFSEIVAGGGNLPGDLDSALGVKSIPSTAADASSTPMLGSARALFTYFEGCWLNSYSASYTADAAIVTENGSVTVTDIIDGLSQYGEWIDTGLAPVGSAAGQGYSLRFAGGAGSPTAPG